MENSTNSKSKPFHYTSSNKERSSANDDATTFEESGWTMYFEDFFANDINEEENASSLPSENHHESSSLISDAASLIAKNPNIDEQLVWRHKIGERTLSNFKKRRTKAAAGLIDDALEDTASSPVNSPMEKRSGSSQHLQVDERSDLGFDGSENEQTKLKKRGLCLVPLSMVMNYIG